MSPVKPVDPSLKATSPSKVVQSNVDNSWNQQAGTTDPKKAIADKHTSNPYPVKGGGK